MLRCQPRHQRLETRAVSTPQLGPVGGRIAAEVILRLLFADEKGSYLRKDPSWTPGGKRDYRLKDFINYALGH